MKKSILILSACLFMACNNEKENNGNAANRDANVEAHSGENISPQLENEGGDRLNVDTISNSGEARDQADDGNLHN